MISDIVTVMWKEARELLAGGGRGKYVPLILLAIYGVFVPLQSGRKWVDSYQMVIFGVVVSIFVVLSVVADTIAGERERHTLETILASRLSDRAILIGKISAVVLYGWGLTIASLVLGLIAVDLKLGGHPILFYPAGRAGAVVALTLLLSILSTGLGVLVSLRASTVRQAQQILTIGWVAIVFVSISIVRALPAATRASLLRRFHQWNLTEAVLIVVALLVALNVIVLAVDSVRFQRSRLILD